ncbi:MAG TPA: transcriptional repressor LexA [Planctomycetota bacterium]
MVASPTHRALTPRQQAALAAVRAHLQRHGYPPTRAELGVALAVSAQTADFHLRALERKGWLRRARGGRARGLEIVPSGASERPVASAAPARRIPVMGRVAAGDPQPALGEHAESVPVPDGTRADFALRVHGDSMIDAGILAGDLVLVESTPSAARGEIVVALLGAGESCEATVKEYRPGGKRIVLHAANPAYADIVVDRGTEFALAGRVVGVLRLWS